MHYYHSFITAVILLLSLLPYQLFAEKDSIEEKRQNSLELAKKSYDNKIKQINERAIQEYQKLRIKSNGGDGWALAGKKSGKGPELKFVF